MQSPDNSPSPHESLTSFSKVGKYARNLKKTNLQRLKAGEAPEPDGHLVFKKTNLQRLKAGEEPEANGDLKLKKTNPQRLKAVEEPEADGHLKLYEFYLFIFLFIHLFISVDTEWKSSPFQQVVRRSYKNTAVGFESWI